MILTQVKSIRIEPTFYTQKEEKLKISDFSFFAFEDFFLV